ncbi:DUF397 domain-containing protein [Sphaerisporangium album]|uniref:DUF397 domain-containing protein n=1 Tax=Sphaerisporangium album TaxID=509200 RepID=A0A367FJK7_9ACTN|nr:DUF397 domain-containing protein [Sphaerisporangium album]RCG29820.1 DUF397 domain-containing protein [Sphaerisporangium album]
MDLRSAAWQKSSYSGDNGGQCVEVASNLPRIVAIRDSKNSDGPALISTPSEWNHFLSAIKSHSFTY